MFRVTREFLWTSGPYEYRGLLDPETWLIFDGDFILNIADDCTIEYAE